ncbi:tyrosine-type recombinase/integrase [Methanotrichaceae archaeon M04Ac]|uniref:Tyrosine-type recombinase/integrase n=1 Tax=Candidatus Methanocrinis alkalitolerans TaxID=3033395 RepID=A0ABT5XBL5_9EURY|nr:tyrosine-type recombinase/integrase [Candidatus Methanocrinis alkalitolerans]MDF0592103.1 tyrosine-type recombinase/integrase [Candidatus Methanocrinis alkalitolerans]
MIGSTDKSSGMVSDTGKRPPAERIIDRFERDCSIRGMSPLSVKSYVYNVQKFHNYLQERGLNLLDADKDVLRDYLEFMRYDRGLHQKTVENNFTTLSSFYEYLAYEGFLEENPVLQVRKRYLRRYKDNDDGQTRQLISVEDMTRLINSTLDARDKAIITLFAKTGIRRKELIALDVDDIEWVEQSIRLKPTAKRTNRTIFFDDETSFILRRWLRVRESRNKDGSKALFINNRGERIQRSGVSRMVEKVATQVGLHDPTSDKMEDHFSPHCCRHWFTTHLRRAGMPREFIQELRGDVRKEAIDIYDHIDKKELRESYLAHIPQMGI